MFIFIAAFYVCMLAFAAAMLALWIWMIIDVATKEPDGNDKIVWLLVVLLAHGLGAVIYYFARKLPRDRAAAQRVSAAPPTA